MALERWSWAAPALTQEMGQKANYNPVAPRDMPVLWLMHGIVCMDLAKSWLTTRPFSPLPPAAAGLGRVDVRMASLIDCCGIKQKPFLGKTGGSPPVLCNVGEIIILTSVLSVAVLPFLVSIQTLTFCMSPLHLLCSFTPLLHAKLNVSAVFWGIKHQCHMPKTSSNSTT